MFMLYVITLSMVMTSKTRKLALLANFYEQTETSGGVSCHIGRCGGKVEREETLDSSKYGNGKYDDVVAERSPNALQYLWTCSDGESDGTFLKIAPCGYFSEDTYFVLYRCPSVPMVAVMSLRTFVR